MWREIEVIQLIGKRLIIHNDDHDNETIARKLARKPGQAHYIKMMSFSSWGSTDPLEAIVLDVSDISECHVRI